MTSKKKEQDALIKTANQMERLAIAIEDQHKDNVKSQDLMKYATIAMAGATIVMALASIIQLCEK